MKTIKSFGPAEETSLRVSLGDRNHDVASALAGAFEGVGAVEVLVGSLLDVPCDAIVSAANSFGDMGGGIDKAIDDRSGGEAQRRVMAAIADRHLGELPVGAALVVELADRHPRYVVTAPTMRVPGNVSGTINAYLAMRAALVAVTRHNELGPHLIRRLACAGMGTGVGGLSYEDAAMQMRAAYDNVIDGGWRKVVHPALAPFPMR